MISLSFEPFLLEAPEEQIHPLTFWVILVVRGKYTHSPKPARVDPQTGGAEGCFRGGAVDKNSYSLCVDSMPDTPGPLHTLSFNLRKKPSTYPFGGRGN